MIRYIVRDLEAAFHYLPYGLIVGMLAVVILCAINDRRVKKQKAPISVAAHVSFLMYMAILLVITFLSRESGSRNGVDLELFSTWGINDRNNALVVENILLFIPYGFVTAWAFPSLRNLICCTLFGAVTSLGIEYMQMLTSRGYFQIDDIITNTLGAIIGYIVFRCVWAVCRMVRKGVAGVKSKEKNI